MMVKSVEVFFESGCGRCSQFNTPTCKALQWGEGLSSLRSILKKTSLQEEIKWGFPCYTLNGNNVVMIQAFRQYFALMFFKGVLLEDKKKILVTAGDNSQTARQIRFERASDIKAHQKAIQELIAQAIEIESTGKKLPPKEKKALVLPEELINYFKKNRELKKAFEALTPGRQRGYQIFFSQAKQSATRIARIEKYIQHILNGKGYQE